MTRGILRESLPVPSRAREVAGAAFPGVPTERPCWDGPRAIELIQLESYRAARGISANTTAESATFGDTCSHPHGRRGDGCRNESRNFPREVEQALSHAVPDFAGRHPPGVCCRDFGTRRTNREGGSFFCPSLRFGVGFGESAAECRRICGFCRRGDHIMCVYAPCRCFTYDPEIVVVPLSTPTVREVGQDAKRAIELHQGVQATLRAGEAVDGAVVVPAAPAVGDGVKRGQEGFGFHE